MPWYKAGTVNVTLNSNAVTGVGTAFIANCRVGDAFRGPDGRWYEVTNAPSNTSLSISPAYLGPTASGGSYALAPMQGYVKDSADALRAIVNAYGAQLAALGTTGNYDILPVAKGGTGNTTGTAAKLAASAILGSVSQSGGTPTGAIIESGSNANGEFTKFADGRMICKIADAQGVFQNTSNILFDWAFPMPFVGSTPCVSVNLVGTLALTRDIGTVSAYSRTNVGAKCSALSRAAFVSADAAGVTFDVTAIGRWFA